MCVFFTRKLLIFSFVYSTKEMIESLRCWNKSRSIFQLLPMANGDQHLVCGLVFLVAIFFQSQKGKNRNVVGSLGFFLVVLDSRRGPFGFADHTDQAGHQRRICKVFSTSQGLDLVHLVSWVIHPARQWVQVGDEEKTAGSYRSQPALGLLILVETGISLFIMTGHFYTEVAHGILMFQFDGGRRLSPGWGETGYGRRTNLGRQDKGNSLVSSHANGYIIQLGRPASCSYCCGQQMWWPHIGESESK